MRTLSVDLRERILASYDEHHGTREEIAKRYRVSLGMVKKLLRQRSVTGDIRPRHHLSGRKPKILFAHRQQMQALLAEKPDLTLEELRTALGLECSLPAIHYALQALGLTYKKRHSAPANKIVPTSPKRGKAGKGIRPALIPRSSSSSMNPGLRRTWRCSPSMRIAPTGRCGTSSRAHGARRSRWTPSPPLGRSSTQ